MLELILCVAVLAADMILKYCAKTAFQPAVPIISGVLELTYVENKGAAWGLFQGGRVVFLVVSAVFLVFLVWFYLRNRTVFHLLSRVSLCLIFCGTVGNFFDRLVFHYVRDMIYFKLINFPVFNIADSAIVVGAILLCIDVLFFKGNAFDVAEKWIKSWKKPAEH